MSDPLQRRSNPREKINCFAHYLPMYAGPDRAEHLCITRDFSREGLYFLSFNDSVRLNMQLLMSFHHPNDPSTAPPNCLVEVVRIHTVFPGRCGVGVRLISFQRPGDFHGGVIIPETRFTADNQLPSVNLFV